MSGADLKNQLGLAAESDVAALRDVSIASLRNERSKGLGPPFQRIGNKIFYPLDKLRAHLAASTVTPSKPQTMIDGRTRRQKPRSDASA